MEVHILIDKSSFWHWSRSYLHRILWKIKSCSYSMLCLRLRISPSFGVEIVGPSYQYGVIWLMDEMACVELMFCQNLNNMLLIAWNSCVMVLSCLLPRDLMHTLLFSNSYGPSMRSKCTHCLSNGHDMFLKLGTPNSCIFYIHLWASYIGLWDESHRENNDKMQQCSWH